MCIRVVELENTELHKYLEDNLEVDGFVVTNGYENIKSDMICKL